MTRDRRMQVEAARFALLCRLAPAIRHGLVGKLHPIGLLCEVMVRRMKSSPDAAKIFEGLQKLNELSRSAIAACAELTSWLSPDDERPIGFREGAEECLALLNTELGMRGYAVRTEYGDAQAGVSRRALRSVLMGVLIAQTDELEGPASLTLSAWSSEGFVNLSITAAKTEGKATPPLDEAYRKIDWEEVHALAQAEAVQLSRKGLSTRLQFRIQPASK